MKKNKSYNFTIPLVLYPFDFMISINETDEQILSALSGFDLDKEDLELITNINSTTVGRYCLLKNNQTVIRLKRPLDTPAMMGTLSHEIYHAVYNLFDVIGMEMTRASEEAYAYAIGYVTQKVYENIKTS